MAVTEAHLYMSDYSFHCVLVKKNLEQNEANIHLLRNNFLTIKTKFYVTLGASKDAHSCHGGFGYGFPLITDSERILEYADSYKLKIDHTIF